MGVHLTRIWQPEPDGSCRHVGPLRTCHVLLLIFQLAGIITPWWKRNSRLAAWRKQAHSARPLADAATGFGGALSWSGRERWAGFFSRAGSSNRAGIPAMSCRCTRWRISRRSYSPPASVFKPCTRQKAAR
jgi:hypothetical protein